MQLPDTKIMVVAAVVLALIGGNVYLYIKLKEANEATDHCITENANIAGDCADEIDCLDVTNERNALRTQVTDLEATITAKDEAIATLTDEKSTLEDKLDKRNDAVVGVSTTLGVIGIVAILGGGGYFALRKKE